MISQRVVGRRLSDQGAFARVCIRRVDAAYFIASQAVRVCLCLIVTLSVAVVISGCSVVGPAAERPEIRLTSIQPLPRKGLEQRFLIGLNIINVSDSTLSIAGLSYHLLLNGRKVATGVSGEIDAIPGYSESRVMLEASTDLISGLGFVADLLRERSSAVEYEFETSIRTDWWPVPIKLSEQGSIELGDYASSITHRP